MSDFVEDGSLAYGAIFASILGGSALAFAEGVARFVAGVFDEFVAQLDAVIRRSRLWQTPTRIPVGSATTMCRLRPVAPARLWGVALALRLAECRGLGKLLAGGPEMTRQRFKSLDHPRRLIREAGRAPGAQ